MLARLAGGVRLAGRLALDLLLPPNCVTCDAPVGAPGQFCAACFRQTSFVAEPCCARCGVPFTHAGQAGPARICLACLDHPPPWGRARAALAYDEQSRLMVLPFKYADRTDLAAALAPLMARAGAALLREADLLVPVPLHRRRLAARRYNQAALLARALGRLSGVPALPDGLVRSRATQSLAGLSAGERARAVAAAFAVRPRRAAAIAGRRVLLVDDVLTSGATCAACTRALLEGGAAGVDVLVAARVADPRSR
ncbi:MAG: phosphoribosyltransferase [Rhodospirillales bacterium 70-18]|nr:ComF family protein [Rhodospirillales bacterium]OJY64852.1 MAG: phosphoribosyltransferase [Rhodospirillales bacterium 70-18]